MRKNDDGFDSRGRSLGIKSKVSVSVCVCVRTCVRACVCACLLTK